MVIGLAVLLCSVIFLGFPREMPGAKQRRLKHIQQGHLPDTDGVERARMKDLLPELKNLFKNWTFLFNGLGLTATLLYGGSVTVFVAKIFRLKFGLDPVKASYVVSLLSVTGIGCKLALDIFFNYNSIVFSKFYKFCEILKTRVKLILNFPRPHAIT